jgi:hypothetical protein
LQKNLKSLEIGSYRLQIDPEMTKKAYESAELCADEATELFYFLLPSAPPESLLFLEGLGLPPHKIPKARPLSPPDEEGRVLFLCTARLCGVLLAGGDTVPRQSEEEAGISMVFVSQRGEFTPGVEELFEQEVEIRFVMELPFDPAFFEGRESL